MSKKTAKPKTNLSKNLTKALNASGKHVFAILFVLQILLSIPFLALAKTNSASLNKDLSQVLQAQTGPSVEEFGYWNTKWCKPTVSGVQKKSFYSQSMDTWVGYTIYIPDEYYEATNATKKYPVIYFLHGVNGQECNYLSNTENNASSLIDLVKRGVIPPTILVFPNGGKGLGYMDSPGDCKITKECPETMIINELIPHIDNTYRTNASRMGRALEGFSMGGQGTMRLGLKYNNLFCSLGVLSPAYTPNPNEIESYIANDANDISQNMNIKMAVGSVEGLGSLDSVNMLDGFLAKYGIPTTKREVSIANGVGHDLGNLLAATDTKAPNNTIGERLALMHWDCLSGQGTGGDPLPPPNPDPTPDPDPEPDPEISVVESRITASATSGVAPLTVEFSGEGTTSSKGVITDYSWNFGDGVSGKGITQTHTYTMAGRYTVSLIATDSETSQDTANIEINVSSTNSGDSGQDCKPRSIRDRLNQFLGRPVRCR